MSKLLFDATGSANGLQPGWVKLPFYDRDFYNTDRSRGVKEQVQKLALAHVSGPMVWDIERWPLPEYESKLIEIIDWAREVRPDLRQGFYGLMPVRNYWGPVLHSLQIKPNSYDAWVQDNARMARGRGADGRFVSRGLVDAVDFVAPSLYTFYSNADATSMRHETLWHEYAKLTIEEARKHQKPVYPWIWPRFHPSSHPAMEAMSSEAFMAQIETVLKYADGVAIYDSAAIKPAFSCEPIMQNVAARNAAGEYE